MTSGTVSDDGAVFVSNRQNFGRKIVGCGDSFLSQLSVCFVVPQVNKITLRSVQNMASIRKRGSNSYLIVVSRGYDYEGNRLKSVQKTVKPPKEYTPKQAEKWVKEQAILFETRGTALRLNPSTAASRWQSTLSIGRLMLDRRSWLTPHSDATNRIFAESCQHWATTS